MGPKRDRVDKHIAEFRPYLNVCDRCGADDFSPSVEAFEVSGQIVCEDCADEVIEENGQFGLGA